MSMAMMSAPSWARRIAWLRPWPRAAPVTKATLPSTRPAIATASPSGFVDWSVLEVRTGIYRQLDPHHVAALMGGDPQQGVGDFDRLDPRDRQGVQRLGRLGELLPG